MIRFAQENQLSPEKTTVFFSIVKRVFEKTISNGFVHLEKDYAYYKELILTHSVHRPPFSQKIFTPDDLKSITDYMTHTYILYSHDRFFRHYLMYKYVFTDKLKMEFSIENTMPEIHKTTWETPSELLIV